MAAQVLPDALPYLRGVPLEGNCKLPSTDSRPLRAKFNPLAIAKGYFCSTLYKLRIRAIRRIYEHLARIRIYTYIQQKYYILLCIVIKNEPTMTLQFLTQHCYVYSASSQNWFIPSRSIRALHRKIFCALNAQKYISEHVFTGVQECADIYHSFCRPIPPEHLPNGVFTTVLILKTLDDKQYFIFTDIEKLY